MQAGKGLYLVSILSPDGRALFDLAHGHRPRHRRQRSPCA